MSTSTTSGFIADECKSVRLIGNKTLQRFPDINKAMVGTSILGNTFITVKALTENKGKVFIGGSDVTTENGFPLNPGEVLPSLTVENCNILYFISEKESDSISLLIFQ